jgi:putative RNA 2'-phosphotransferase
MQPELVRLSKFLSFVLRHHPERIGLQLDGGGWADVDELVAKAAEAGVPLTRARLEQVVEQNEKRRFAPSDDRRRIRASQGHSIPVDLELAPIPPPELLYHGTARPFVDAIRRDGLTARGRRHVHLSGDEETAIAVGRRHGKPVVLTVESERMARDGHPFYRSANGVWLTDLVPPAYLRFPPDARS